EPSWNTLFRIRPVRPVKLVRAWLGTRPPAVQVPPLPQIGADIAKNQHRKQLLPGDSAARAVPANLGLQPLSQLAHFGLEQRPAFRPEHILPFGINARKLRPEGRLIDLVERKT